MKKLTRDPEFYVLVAATSLSALVSILDFLGLLQALPWLATRIPTLVLLLISIALGYLVVERRHKLDAIEALIRTGNQETLTMVAEGVERVISALQGVDIRLFTGRDEMFAYLEGRIKKAKRSLDVTHTGLSVPNGESPAGQHYYDTFSKVVKEGKVRIRRVVVVQNQAHLEWVRQMLAESSGHPFFLGCYAQPSYYVPNLNLFIIDSEEVCIAGGERSTSYEVKAISVKHPLFIEVIQEHFDKLWRDSMRLNERDAPPKLLVQLVNAIEQP